MGTTAPHSTELFTEDLAERPTFRLLKKMDRLLHEDVIPPFRQLLSACPTSPLVPLLEPDISGP